MSSTGSRKNRQRPQLSLEAVILRAIAIADRNGIEKLSMRTLASELGAEAMSLYHYIRDKDDLIDRMVDHIAGEISGPAENVPWKAALRHRALSTYQVLRRHRWASLHFGLRLNAGPNSLAHVEAMLVELTRAGLPHETADHALNAIDNHIRGFALTEALFPIRPEEYAAAAEAFLPILSDEKYPNMRILAGKIINREYNGLNNIIFGLDLILDGLETIAGAVSATNKKIRGEMSE